MRSTNITPAMFQAFLDHAELWLRPSYLEHLEESRAAICEGITAAINASANQPDRTS